MIYTLNSANQYEGLGRKSEQQFLEFVSCTKHLFYKNYVWNITPSDKHTLICMLSGSMRIKEIDREIVKNDILLSPHFSRLHLEIERSAEFIKIVFGASPILPILKYPHEGTPFVTSGNFPQINKLYQMSNNKKSVVGIKEAILFDLLNDFNEHVNASAAELSIYKRACEWVEAHADSSISAQDVAVALNCTRTHLKRVMKLVDGECLSIKIVRHRLERIKNMCSIKNV